MPNPLCVISAFCVAVLTLAPFPAAAQQPEASPQDGAPNQSAESKDSDAIRRLEERVARIEAAVARLTGAIEKQADTANRSDNEVDTKRRVDIERQRMAELMRQQLELREQTESQRRAGAAKDAMEHEFVAARQREQRRLETQHRRLSDSLRRLADEEKKLRGELSATSADANLVKAAMQQLERARLDYRVRSLEAEATVQVLSKQELGEVAQREAKLAIRQAEEALESTRLIRDRKAKLHKDGVLSITEAQSAEMALRAAEVKLQEALLQQEKVEEARWEPLKKLEAERRVNDIMAARLAKEIDQRASELPLAQQVDELQRQRATIYEQLLRIDLELEAAKGLRQLEVAAEQD